MKNLTRYMFCFPQGGFNDFCQIIWNCLEYCKNFNRILVIDTRYIITFKDDFRKFKEMKEFLTGEQKTVLKEIAEIKRKNNVVWGI